jgi:ABC-type cobalamin/Fe3+-siderophores transport system ATPase subunit
MLKIKNLKASINNNQILNGLNLNINKGEIHAIMGTNGSGKSTLSKVLAGHPSYKITDGEILFENKEINDFTPEERAKQKYYCSLCDVVFFCKAYQDKHLNGKVHMNKIKIQESLEFIKIHQDEKHL